MSAERWVQSAHYCGMYEAAAAYRLTGGYCSDAQSPDSLTVTVQNTEHNSLEQCHRLSVLSSQFSDYSKPYNVKLSIPDP
jgi:secreted trypsin-like serine protease